MDSISQARGGATNLSTPQKVLATLLSIILVVGLSPLGKAPARAYAAAPKDAKTAPLVDHAGGKDNVSGAITLSTYTVDNDWNEAGTVDDVTLKAVGVPKHNNGKNDGYWVGVAVPGDEATYNSAAGWNGLPDSPTYGKENDSTCEIDGVKYLTFYFSGAWDTGGQEGYVSLQSKTETNKVITYHITFNVSTQQEEKTPTGGSVTQGGNKVATVTADGDAYYYPTLDAAISGANGLDGLTYRLVGNANTSGVTFPTHDATLDLNGFALAASGSLKFASNNDFSVTDSSANGGGSIAASAAIADGVLNAAGKADLTVEKVSVDGNAGAALKASGQATVTTSADYKVSAGSGSVAAVDVDDATLDMATGKVDTTKASGANALKATPNSKVVLGAEKATSGPELNGIKAALATAAGAGSALADAGITVNYAKAESVDTTSAEAVSLDSAAAVTIKDGSFKGYTKSLVATSAATGDIVIDGGAFDYANAEGSAYALDIDKAAAAKTKINGGTFLKKVFGNTATEKSAKAEGIVYGGTFSSELTSLKADGTVDADKPNYAATGYAQVSTKSGDATTYSVKRDLSTFTLSNLKVEDAAGGALTYNGTDQAPAIKVYSSTAKKDEELLSEGADYTLKLYKKTTTINASTADATLDSSATSTVDKVHSGEYLARIQAKDGSDKYTGSAKVEFAVAKADLSKVLDDLSVELRINAEYSWFPLARFAMERQGSTQLKPEVFVKYGDDVIYSDDSAKGRAVNAQLTKNYGTNTSAGEEAGVVTLAVAATGTPDEDTFETASAIEAVKFNVTGTDVANGTYGALAATDYSGALQVPALDVTVGGTKVKFDAASSTDPAYYTNFFESVMVTLPTNGAPVPWATAAPTTSATPANEFFNAGTYKIKFTGKASAGYTGTKEIEYKINQIELTDATTTPTLTTSTAYTGSAITPVVTAVAYDNGKTDAAQRKWASLTKDQDYIVSPDSVTDADDYTVTISGKAPNFTGSVQKPFSVSKATFDAVGAGANVKYDGKAKQANFTFYKGGAVVGTVGDNFKATYYKKNADGTYSSEALDAVKDAGTYRAVVVGDGSYQFANATDPEANVCEVTVDPADMGDVSQVANIAITFDDASVTYEGTPIDPKAYVKTATVTFKGADEAVELGSGDYAFRPDKVSGNGAKGLSVYGQGNFTGMFAGKVSFNVKASKLSDVAEITSIAPSTYAGKVLNPEVVVTNTKTGQPLKEGVDYDVTYEMTENNAGEKPAGSVTTLQEAGTYTATVTARAGSGYAGALEQEGYVVAKASLSGVTIPEGDGAFATMTYSGVAQEPKFSASETLVAAASGAYDAGTYPYVELAAKDKFGDLGKLYQGVDFSLAKVTEAGEYAKLVLTGTGNFDGEVESTYKVAVGELDLKNGSTDTEAKIQFVRDGVYTDTITVGVDERPDVRVALVKKSDKSFIAELDKSNYELSYSGNNAASTAAKVTVTPKYDTQAKAKEAKSSVYGAAFDATFSTTDQSMKGATIELGAEPQATFDGKGLTVKPVVKLVSGGAEKTLEVAYNGQTVKDYRLLLKRKSAPEASAVDLTSQITSATSGYAFAAPLEADTYTLIAQGINYSDSVSAEFTVAPLPIDGMGVTLDCTDEDGANTLTYDGTEKSVAVTAVDLGTAELNALFAASSFEVAYEGGRTDAGTFTAVVKPKANATYASSLDGSKPVEVEIGKADFDSAYWMLPEAVATEKNGKTTYSFKTTWTYTGSKITAEDAGIGVYAVADFVKADVDTTVVANQGDALASAQVAELVRTGEVKPVSSDGYTLVAANNTVVGTYNSTWSPDEGVGFVASAGGANPNYKGVLEFDGTIAQAPFDKDAITVKADDQEYTGSPIEKVELSLGEYKLVPGTDYIAEYKNQTNVGTATATFVGQGNFENGVIEASFKINPTSQSLTASPASVSFAEGGSAVFTVSGAATALSVSAAGVAQAALVGNNVTVTATGAGTGSVTVTAAADANHAAAAVIVPVTVTAAPAPEPPAPVVKSANSYKVTKAKTATVKYKKLKKKVQTLAISKVLAEVKGQGTMTYTVTKVKKGKKTVKKANFKINKTSGKITVKKKLAKGTYKVTLTAKAAGDDTHEASAKVTKTVTVKVK